MTIANKKTLLTAVMTLFAGFAMAQEPISCSVYVKMKSPAKAYKAMAKQYGLSTKTRKVKSELLFTNLNQSATAMQLKNVMQAEAFSMRVGNRLQNCYRIDLQGVTSQQQALEMVKSLPEVETAELARTVELMTEEPVSNMPNDPLLSLSEIDGSWHLKQIGYDKLYGQYEGNPNIKVAVVDNAVWSSHPDLDIKPENQYFAYIDEVGNSSPPSSVDQDNDCKGLSTCPAALWSHGTHCAGLVAAVSNNGEGVASVASGVTLMAARCADKDPKYMNKSLEGVLWAIDNGADVLSLSWGSSNISEFEQEIIQGALEKGIVVVAAAGNDGVEKKKYPAAYEGVIAVGSVDSDNKRSFFSNYGSWVTLAAPGGNLIDEQGKATMSMILSTTFSTSHMRFYGSNEIDGLYYDGMIGTSMATPVISSVVGLMLSVNPDLTPAEVKDILMQTATPTDTWDMAEGSGVVNAYEAVKKAESMASGIENNSINDNIGISCADGRLRLSAPVRKLTIVNTSGHTVMSTGDTRQNIDISHLPKGIYIVSAQGDRCWLTKKITVR